MNFKSKKQGNFSHVNARGEARMVDISKKPPVLRLAVAQGKIYLARKTLNLIRANKMQKGDVLTVAKIAGISAAKETPHLIPLCHPLLLNNIEVQLQVIKDGVVAESRVQCIDRTGVEMEALIAVSVSLLTIYDMCKAVDKTMVIGDVRLIKKEKYSGY